MILLVNTVTFQALFLRKHKPLMNGNSLSISPASSPFLKIHLLQYVLHEAIPGLPPSLPPIGHGLSLLNLLGNIGTTLGTQFFCLVWPYIHLGALLTFLLLFKPFKGKELNGFFWHMSKANKKTRTHPMVIPRVFNFLYFPLMIGSSQWFMCIRYSVLVELFCPHMPALILLLWLCRSPGPAGFQPANPKHCFVSL